MAKVTFHDYVDHQGRNVITDWMDNDISSDQRGDLTTRLVYLEAFPIEQWPTSHVKMLQGKECKSLLEIRVKSGNVQLRPLFMHGPQRGESTILVGATKKMNISTPRKPCKVAQRRRTNLESGTGSNIRHVYEE